MEAKTDLADTNPDQKALALRLEHPGMKRRMEEMLPKHLTPERMVRIALMAANKNPALYRCSPESFLKAMMDASEVGLEAGGMLQHAALVPYKGQVQFQPMVRGLIELAKRGGEVLDVEPAVVYDGDLFEHERGYNPRLRHVEWDYRPKDQRPAERGDIKAAYALFWLKGLDRPKVEVVPKRDLEKIRNASQAKSPESPWNKWPDEMRKKTAIKRGCKTLRLSPEMARAIELDNNLSGVIDVDAEIIPVPPDAPPLAAGRHDLAAKKKAPKPKAEKKATPQPAPPMDRDPMIATISAFIEDRDNGEAFVKACEGCAIDPETWTEAPDGRLLMLFGKVVDLKAAKE